MKSTLPEVPKPDMGPKARFHASKLDPVTGLYSMHCSVCGAPNATAWAGLDGEYCQEHTPENVPVFAFGHSLDFGTEHHSRKDSPESLPPIPCSYLMGKGDFKPKSTVLRHDTLDNRGK